MARPREYDEELRVRLIEEAARLLGEEGPAAVSVRRVAAACDTSTAAIYSLLGNKGALVRAVYLEGFRRLGERLDAVGTEDDPLDRLGAQHRAYFDNAMANPHLYAVMFGPVVPEFSPSGDDVLFALGTLQQLVDCVADCIEAGHFAGDATEIALELWAASHGVCTLALVGMLGTIEEARAHDERIGAALVTGLAALSADA